MKKFYAVVFFIFFFFLSCTQYIEIDPPPYESEIFSVAILEEGQPVSVFVNRTVSLQSPDMPTALPDATVILKNDGNFTDTLQYDPNKNFYVSSHTPSPQYHYSLQIKYQNQTASSETDFPPPPQIRIMSVEHVTIPEEEYTTDALKVNFRIQDPPGKNFYQIRLFYNTGFEWEEFYLVPTDINDPVILSEAIIYFTEIYFSDEIFDGNEYHLTLYFDDSYPLIPGDSLLLVSYALSEYAYQWMKYIHIELYTDGLFENMEPAFIPDNMEGGLGIFGAKTPDSTYFIIR